tara:strand:- start:11667 stop:12245 length:579 start_codon:yes stop_codon:yes gene_type:complete
VCGGVAQYFVVDSTIVRLIWIFFTLFGGSGLIIYIIAAIIIPDEHTQERTFNLDSLKNNPLWGILFIFVGIVLFFQYNHVLFLFWGSFWDNFLNILVAFILLGVGIYLLYNRRIEIKKTTEYNIGEEPLHLSIEDKKLAGVCGGFGESLNLDPNLVRVLWIFGTLMSVGIGILLYIVLALVLPERAIVSEDI